MSAFYNDTDKKVCAWMRELIRRGHITDGVVDERSIKELGAGDLDGYSRCHFFAGIGGWDYALRLAGWPDDWPVWTGSCPCQPFSSAGSRGGVFDSRDLWPDFIGLIREGRPPVIFGEQVAHDLGWWDRAADDLELSGYAVWSCVLCSSIVGDPERPRLFWVADSDGLRQSHGSKYAETPRLCATPGSSPRAWCAVRGVGSSGDGIPAGVVKGYGNAINPKVAAIFVRAFMESVTRTEALDG